MIAYLAASLFTAVICALFSLLVLDASWLMTGAAYLIGGWVGFAATLLSVMMQDGDNGPPLPQQLRV